MPDILDALNNEQKDAVTSTEGFVRVIAGAGTGKTKALTHRYAYLINELGISPSNILCITFTNKAASEMKYRIKKLLGDEFDTSFVATLHSFCVRILREDISKLFYPESFIVLDNIDQKKILEEVYDEMGVRMDTASFQFMIDKIRYYKNLLTYLDYLTDSSFDLKNLTPKNTEEAIIFRYIEKQKKYFGLDFFDLINFAIYLFRKFPGVTEKWQKRIHYVQVDEFQDITVKEFKFIREITLLNKNWFVVGDPDQNIYEWRGSRMHVLLDFADNMTPCKSIIMSNNYRSTPEILAAANSLIEVNKVRIKKELYTNNQSIDFKPEYFHGKNDKLEIKYIIDNIRGIVSGGEKYGSTAILYRSNFVSRFAEQGLLNENIPYVIYGGIGFYERMEIKDVLSYMRLVDTGDDLSFLRIINVPRRKIGKVKLAFIKEKAELEHAPLYDTMKKYIDDPIFKDCSAHDFIDTIEKLRALAGSLSVSELLQRILIETKYELYIRESGDMERLDNVSELLRSIVTQENEYGEYFSLSAFLQTVTLIKDADLDGDRKLDAVKLMTVHTAKGLEFSNVFIVGLTDGIFPSARALEDRKSDALEEERRLAFVAMTRAKKRLFLTESEGIGVKGYLKVPSRFIFNIEKSLLNYINEVPDEIMKNYSEQVFDYDESGIGKPEVYQTGTQIKHKVFGEGIVEEVNEQTKTYYIRFVHGVKPISFDYKGLSHIF